MLPSCPSPSRAELQGLHKLRPPRRLLRVDTKSSHGLAPSFRVLQASSRRRRLLAPKSAESTPTSSREVSRPFSVSPHSAAASFEWPGLPHRTACTYRFSQPPGAFIRPVPGGLVSCHIRSWGCTLQSFAPPAQQDAVSSAFALLSFGRTQTPHHAHRKRPKPTTMRSPTLHRRPKSTNTGRNRRQLTSRPPATSRVPIQARERPRLQGFAPHESPPLTAGGLDRRRARSSPGLHTLQGSLPRWNRTAFTALPLMGFLRSGASDRTTGPPGSRFLRDRLASLEAAGPPGLCRLVTITNVWFGRGSGVASSGPGVRHRPLSNHL
jgi:hypothetical protein